MFELEPRSFRKKLDYFKKTPTAFESGREGRRRLRKENRLINKKTIKKC